jgi:hypothetical protein
MVNRQFTQGVSWLHARVGRRVPVQRRRDSDQRASNSHAKTYDSALVLRPTVYLPASSGGKLVA